MTIRPPVVLDVAAVEFEIVIWLVVVLPEPLVTASNVVATSVRPEPSPINLAA